MDCRLCKHIFTHLLSFSEFSDDDEIEWTDDDLYPDFPNLDLSASNGCRLCGFLRCAIIDDFGVRPIDLDVAASEDTLSRWEGRVSFKSQKISATFRVPCIVRLRLELGWSRRDIHMSVYNPSDRSRRWITDMDFDPFCEVGSVCIKKWLKQCSKHEACQPPTAFVPTRLLDVGNEAADQQHLRIVLGKALDEKVSYSALSYCWGNSPSSQLSAESARTVQANLTARLGHVSEETLPQTIQDAITVTRWLGIRYLWVDLLCIVQDDPLDWSKESQVMGNIFHHASLTIAATSAVSITQGFLRRPRCQRIKIPINSNAEKPDLMLRYPEWLMHEYVWDNDWRTRGWIFQEQKLSHRVLHFTRGILYFECASGFRCEWMEMRPELSDDDNEWVLQNPFWKPQCFLGANNPTTFDTWYGDVEWFSMKTLTFPEDKLPAISGLARVTAKVVGSRYLAGLWMDDLHIGLLWKAPTSCILRRPLRSRAPSWSWAALDGTLEWQTYRSDSDMPLAKVLNVDVIPDPSDPQKRLFTGFLDLDGCLMKFQDAEDHDILQNPCGNNGDYRTDSTWYVSDLGVEFTRPSSLWVLPILFEEMVRGLILEPTSKGNDPNEFRRVGWYESEPQRNRVLKALESQNTTSVRIV